MENKNCLWPIIRGSTILACDHLNIMTVEVEVIQFLLPKLSPFSVHNSIIYFICSGLDLGSLTSLNPDSAVHHERFHNFIRNVSFPIFTSPISWPNPLKNYCLCNIINLGKLPTDYYLCYVFAQILYYATGSVWKLLRSYYIFVWTHAEFEFHLELSVWVWRQALGFWLFSMSQISFIQNYIFLENLEEDMKDN